MNSKRSSEVDSKAEGLQRATMGRYRFSIQHPDGAFRRCSGSEGPHLLINRPLMIEKLRTTIHPQTSYFPGTVYENRTIRRILMTRIRRLKYCRGRWKNRTHRERLVKDGQRCKSNDGTRPRRWALLTSSGRLAESGHQPHLRFVTLKRNSADQ